MRSAARAIGWEFRQRHGVGFLAICLYLVALAVYKFGFDHDPPINLVEHDSTPDISQRFAFTVIVPLTSAFIYLLAVFSFGLSSDVAARESIYPARMFTLPVSTRALAGWPMIYGTAAMAILWFASALLGLWPSGVHVPLIWPALFVAAFLAWAQALMWMPYPLRGIRIGFAVLLLTSVDAVVISAIYFKAGDALMIAILAPQIPLAYVTATFALGRSRRGDVPDWRGLFHRMGWLADVLPRHGHQFSSSYSAQAWYDWRQNGASLPVWVAILLPFELALLFLADGESRKLVYYTLLTVLLTPPVVASFAAAGISKANPDARDSFGVSPFIATRPMTTAAFIGAKLKATLWSTVAAWLLVSAAIPLALMWSGTSAIVVDPLRGVIDFIGTGRAVAIGWLVMTLLLLSTWKHLVQTLFVGLSGHNRIVKTNLVLTIAFLVSVLPILEWFIGNDERVGMLWDALPWILGVLVALKLCAAAWVTLRLDAGRLLSGRALVICAASWCAAVLGMYGLLVWIIATPLFPHYFIALVAILIIPLARLAAAPLALAWNRHR